MTNRQVALVCAVILAFLSAVAQSNILENAAHFEKWLERKAGQ